MEEIIEQARADSEHRQQEQEQEDEVQNLMQIEQKETETKSELNNIIIKRTMSDEELYLNLIKMTIMWTSASFN